MGCSRRFDFATFCWSQQPSPRSWPGQQLSDGPPFFHDDTVPHCDSTSRICISRRDVDVDVNLDFFRAGTKGNDGDDRGFNRSWVALELDVEHSLYEKVIGIERWIGLGERLTAVFITLVPLSKKIQRGLPKIKCGVHS